MTTADEESRQDPSRAVDDVRAIGEIVDDREDLWRRLCRLRVLQGLYLLPLVVQDPPEFSAFCLTGSQAESMSTEGEKT